MTIAAVSAGQIDGFGGFGETRVYIFEHIRFVTFAFRRVVCPCLHK